MKLFDKFKKAIGLSKKEKEMAGEIPVETPIQEERTATGGSRYTSPTAPMKKLKKRRNRLQNQASNRSHQNK